MQPDSKQPFYSIVMPCFGVESYIGRAIECVQAQTFKDWELIIVDDCSTDGSAAITAQYALTDDRIQIVHHQENRGLSEARNTGIRHARGVYLWMPDPDDTYDSNLLALVYDSLSEGGSSLEHSADAVLFGHVEEYFDESGSFLYERDFPLTGGVYKNPDEWHRLVLGLERGTHYGYAWNKVYRLDRLRNLQLYFEEIRLIEDIVFNVSYFQDAKELHILAETPYRYAKRQGKSLTNANAYSAAEYYDLHRHRIRIIHDQLESWGVFDEDSREILGSLFGRYILSTLERQCGEADMSRRERKAWSKRLYKDPLFIELLPAARAESLPLKTCLALLKTKNATINAIVGDLLHTVRKSHYATFTHVRSER